RSRRTRASRARPSRYRRTRPDPGVAPPRPDRGCSSACGAPPPESSRGTTSPCRAGRGRRGGRSCRLWVERPCPHAARDLLDVVGEGAVAIECLRHLAHRRVGAPHSLPGREGFQEFEPLGPREQLDRDDARRVPENALRDRKSTRLNSSHLVISYAVFCLKKKITETLTTHT